MGFLNRFNYLKICHKIFLNPRNPGYIYNSLHPKKTESGKVNLKIHPYLGFWGYVSKITFKKPALFNFITDSMLYLIYSFPPNFPLSLLEVNQAVILR